MQTDTGRRIVTGLLLACCVLANASFAEPLAPFEVAIENIPNARIGDNIEISVSYLSGSEVFNEMKLIVAYNPAELELLEVLPGAVPTLCDWDSFVHTVIACPGCDWETVEIGGMADDPAVFGLPFCYSPVGDLARIRFQIRPDTLNAGNHSDINFYWVDCSSNTLGSVAQDTVWHGKFAFDHVGTDITGIDPNLGGTLAGCVVPGAIVPIRAINTTNGGVQINAAWGKYGDVNGDGRFNITDIYYLIYYIFDGGGAPKDYLHGDYDGDERVTISDAVFLFNYLFLILQQGD